MGTSEAGLGRGATSTLSLAGGLTSAGGNQTPAGGHEVPGQGVLNVSDHNDHHARLTFVSCSATRRLDSSIASVDHG